MVLALTLHTGQKFATVFTGQKFATIFTGKKIGADHVGSRIYPPGNVNNVFGSSMTRSMVENYFGKLKENRGIAMRSCKTDQCFIAFISLAATVIELR